MKDQIWKMRGTTKFDVFVKIVVTCVIFVTFLPLLPVSSAAIGGTGKTTISVPVTSNVTITPVPAPVQTETQAGVKCSSRKDETRAIYVREHSLEKEEIEEAATRGTILENWEMRGNSTIEDGKAVRLFPSGSLWNSWPVDMEGWEIQLQVDFHGKNDQDEHEQGNSSGKTTSGLKFWYTRFIMPPMGSKSRSEGLLILLEKTDHGIVGSASMNQSAGEVNNSTISATVNNRTGDNYIDFDWQLSGCSTPYVTTGNETWLKIRYENNHLSVSTKQGGSKEENKDEEWVSCFMKKEDEDLYLPVRYFFGISPISDSMDETTGAEEWLDIFQIKTFDLSSDLLDSVECLEDDEDTLSPSSKVEVENAPTPVPAPPISKHYENVKEDSSYVHDRPVRKMIEMIFPYNVLWVPVVGFFVIIAFCVMGMYVYSHPAENLPERFY